MIDWKDVLKDVSDADFAIMTKAIEYFGVIVDDDGKYITIISDYDIKFRWWKEHWDKARSGYDSSFPFATEKQGQRIVSLMEECNIIRHTGSTFNHNENRVEHIHKITPLGVEIFSFLTL